MERCQNCEWWGRGARVEGWGVCTLTETIPHRTARIPTTLAMAQVDGSTSSFLGTVHMETAPYFGCMMHEPRKMELRSEVEWSLLMEGPGHK